MTIDPVASRVLGVGSWIDFVVELCYNSNTGEGFSPSPDCSLTTRYT